MQAKVSCDCELLIIILGCADKYVFCERPSDLYRAFKPSTCVCSSASSYLVFFFFPISFFSKLCLCTLCIPFCGRDALEWSWHASVFSYFTWRPQDTSPMCTLNNFCLFFLNLLAYSLEDVNRIGSSLFEMLMDVSRMLTSWKRCSGEQFYLACTCSITLYEIPERQRSRRYK